MKSNISHPCERCLPVCLHMQNQHRRHASHDPQSWAGLFLLSQERRDRRSRCVPPYVHAHLRTTATQPGLGWAKFWLLGRTALREAVRYEYRRAAVGDRADCDYRIVSLHGDVVCMWRPSELADCEKAGVKRGWLRVEYTAGSVGWVAPCDGRASEMQCKQTLSKGEDMQCKHSRKEKTRGKKNQKGRKRRQNRRETGEENLKGQKSWGSKRTAYTQVSRLAPPA